MNLDKIVKELLNDSKSGLKTTKENVFPGFYSRVNGKNNFNDDKLPVIDIPNYEYFLIVLNGYLEKAIKFYDDEKDYYYFEDDNEFIKQLIVGLFMNASEYDLIDIYSYIEKRTKMFEGLHEKEFITKYKDINVNCVIRKNQYLLESPYKFLIILKKDEKDRFILPTLNFSIMGNKAYLYAVQNISKNKQTSELSKNLDRYFRKVNKGVDLDSEIAKVTPNALVALTVFASYLKSINVDEIIALDYMPLRYSYHKEIVEYFNQGEESFKRLDEIQYNVTDKFMNLMNRYNYHFESKDSYYDDLKGEMHLRLNGRKKDDDNIINDIDNVFKKSSNKNTHR